MRSRWPDGWICDGNKSTGEFWGIAVLPNFERRGIGTSLADKIEGWLREVGTQEASLAVIKSLQVDGYAFFKARGWEDGEYRGLSRVMKKKL